MSDIVLSKDIVTITAEINSYKQLAGQAVFEIGKRLKHVKDNDLSHGQWESWLTSIDIQPRTAQRMMQAAEQFPNTTHASLLPTSKIFDLLSLPESVDRQDFVQNKHEIPSTGESKTVNEMSREELREVKRILKEKEELLESTKQSASYWQKQAEQAKNIPPTIETKTIEVIPESVKRELQQKDNQLSNMKNSMEIMGKRLENMEQLSKAYERDSKEYKELKNQISFLSREKDDLHRQIESATALSGVAAEIDNFLKTKLAPIKYSRVWERMDSEVAVTNFTDILNNVRSWLEDMERYVPKKNRKIVEVIDYEPAG